MSAVSREHILSEIRRTAKANGGEPLGMARFLQETGIKVTDWDGRYWARWSDALREAGFTPNKMVVAHHDGVLISRLIDLMRELGRFPVRGELALKARSDPTFPSAKTFARRGSKQQLVSKVLAYIRDRAGYDDVRALCAAVAGLPTEPDWVETPESGLVTEAVSSTKEGYVYMALLTLGREKRYKIGKAVLVARRTDQISLQLPEDLELIHAIRTDDAYGIEDYWHKRFASKNSKGEWFTLSRQDIEAFRRRKFM